MYRWHSAFGDPILLMLVRSKRDKGTDRLRMRVRSELLHVALLGSIAQRKNAAPAQSALAWLLAQKPDCSPPRHLEPLSSG